MIPATAPSAAIPSKGLAQRAVGIIFSPRSTYADVVAHPRVAGMLVAVLVVAVAASFAFFSTSVGKDALLDQA